jgi:hypothetical protein
VLLTGLTAQIPVAAAPPTLPACAPAFTENPLDNNWEVVQPNGDVYYLLTSRGPKMAGPCAGGRIEGWTEPKLPSSVTLDKELVFEWDASCGSPNRPTDDCLRTWDTELELFRKQDDGSLQAVPIGDADGLHFDVPRQPECTGTGNVAFCQKLILRSANGTLPRDLVALVGVTGRDMTKFSNNYDKLEYGLPWLWKAVPVVAPGQEPGSR